MMKLSVGGRWLLAFVLVGLAARLAVAVASGLNAPPFPPPDATEYDSQAWNLAQGRGFRGRVPTISPHQERVTAVLPPGGQLVWAGLYRLFGHRYDIVRIFQSLVGAFTIIFVYSIARRCFDERTGLLAAGVYALWPAALFMPSQFQMDVLGTFWFLAFILAALKFAPAPNASWAILAGVLLGCALLTRPALAFFALLLPAWALWQFRHNLRGLLLALLIPLGAMLILTPWVVRNYLVFGRFVPLGTSRYSTLLMANNWIAATNQMWAGYGVPLHRLAEWETELKPYTYDEFVFDEKCRELAVRWIKENPKEWWKLVWVRFRRGWSPLLQPHVPLRYRLGMLASWTPVLALFLVAFVPTLVKFLRERSPGWLIHLGILHVSLAFIAFPAVKRYRYPVEPLCIILACVAAIWIWERLRARRGAGQRFPV